MTQIDEALAALRKKGRRVVRIIDIHCGDGCLLIRAAERAVALGFVALEGRGFDRSAANIAEARAAACACALPGMRLVFVQRLHRLPIPADCEVDLMLADLGEDPLEELDTMLGPQGVVVAYGFPLTV